MKTIEQVCEETKTGDVYTLKDFMDYAECGCITEYDGIGYFHDGEQETAIEVFSPTIWNKFEVDDMLKMYPYVIWCNK